MVVFVFCIFHKKKRILVNCDTFDLNTHAKRPGKIEIYEWIAVFAFYFTVSFTVPLFGCASYQDCTAEEAQMMMEKKKESYVMTQLPQQVLQQVPRQLHPQLLG